MRRSPPMTSSASPCSRPATPGRWATTPAAGAFRTLIEHWNGSAWRQQASPDPGPASSVLIGVDASAGTAPWAAGDFDNGHGSQSLVLRWNGTRWAQVPSPNPHGSSELEGVSAASASNAWAVGGFTPDPGGTAHRTLAFHCQCNWQ